MDDPAIQNLLQQVSFISRKYEEVAKITGENFNIFRILNLEASEVRTHSAFLAEMLNPKGSHNQGEIFLKLFLSQLKIKDFDTESIKVRVEFHAGSIDQDWSSGGFVDIIIENSKGQGIIIENKIYAGDQKNQLIRYYEYGTKTFRSFFNLFYLTRLGSEPDKISTQGRLKSGEHFYLVSYKDQITKWLEDCRKESVNLPLVRETITQYLNTIKDLTGQSKNKKMSNEIAKIITANEQSLNAAIDINGSMDSVYQLLFDKLSEQLKTLSEKDGFEFKKQKQSKEKYSGFKFDHPKLREKNLLIQFEFQRINAQDYIFGIRRISPDIKEEQDLYQKFKEKFTEKYGTAKNTPAWMIWNFWGEIRHWNKKEYGEIISGKMAERIMDRVLELKSIALSDQPAS